ITIFKGDTSDLKNVVNLAEKVQPAHFEKEVEKIYRRAWLPVTTMADLPQRGSYVSVYVPPVKASILVVRGQDDVVRAFYNICRHRGNKLVNDGEAGCKLAFSCPFHAWTFAADGRCVLITDDTQFPNLNKADYGLLPVHCEVSGPL